MTSLASATQVTVARTGHTTATPNPFGFAIAYTVYAVLLAVFVTDRAFTAHWRKAAIVTAAMFITVAALVAAAAGL